MDIATDVMGSAIETVSTTDLVAASIYTPYGEPVEASGHHREETVAGQFGFRGELDTSVGLHLRAREYDPHTGQLTTVDPIDGLPGMPVETSPYHYANNDPVNWIDPLGLTPASDDDFAVGIPDAPTPPRADAGAGEHGSEPWYSRGDDYAVRELAYRAADAAELVKGWDNAARHLRHYLGNSGNDLHIDPYRIAGDVAAFAEHLDARAREAAAAAAQRAIAAGNYDTPIPFTSDWSGFYLTKGLSEDWFYALGGVSTATTGVITVRQGSPPIVEVSYQSHLYDRYNWDAGKAVTIGPLTVEDEQLAKLHRAGVAQEYDVVGSSDVRTFTCALGDVCPIHVIPGAPGSGGRR